MARVSGSAGAVTPAPRLIVLSDTERAPIAVWLAQLERLVSKAAPGSVLVLLRDRQMAARARQALGERLRELTARHAQHLAVNDRLDLAVLCSADAVHRSESSVSLAETRAFGRRYAREWWISSACHDVEQVAGSDDDGVLLSPVAEARKGRRALGISGISRARAALDRRGAGAPRLYALGGVTPANASELLAAGAHGVALIGALLEPGAPEALIDSLELDRFIGS
jgi:thiamine-phosphate pyrophosphorylase